MPVPQGNYGGGQPSCFDRMKMGFMMGMVVGMCSGLHNTISTNIYINILENDTLSTNICHKQYITYLSQVLYSGVSGP